MGHLIGIKAWCNFRNDLNMQNPCILHILPQCEAISSIEYCHKLGYELVRFGGFEVVFKSLVNDNKEHNFIAMIESAQACKVFRQWTQTKC